MGKKKDKQKKKYEKLFYDFLSSVSKKKDKKKVLKEIYKDLERTEKIYDDKSAVYESSNHDYWDSRIHRTNVIDFFKSIDSDYHEFINVVLQNEYDVAINDTIGVDIYRMFINRKTNERVFHCYFYLDSKDAIKKAYYKDKRCKLFNSSYLGKEEDKKKSESEFNISEPYAINLVILIKYDENNKISKMIIMRDYHGYGPLEKAKRYILETEEK